MEDQANSTGKKRQKSNKITTSAGYSGNFKTITN
jgi:hypothetical protein